MEKRRVCIKVVDSVEKESNGEYTDEQIEKDMETYDADRYKPLKDK